MAHVYDWLRGRGYWLAASADTPPSHLLLDGGKVAVPDEAHGAFLSAYAASLARHPDRPPCMVEVRTPVFKMFVDLDTVFPSDEDATRFRERTVVELAQRLCVAVGSEDCVVCAADSTKPAGEGVKQGYHLVWPEVLVTARTALALRDRMLDVAAQVAPGFDWPKTLDASVFRSSGLRMPWSAKGRGDARVYTPLLRVREGGAVEHLDVRKVSEVRQFLHALTIRTFRRDPTLLLDDGGGEDGDDGDRAPSTAAAGTRASLAAYADVLPRLADCLPLQFAGQKFTSLIRSEHCYMLRSTSRFCFNLGRTHNTNNVYFALTRRGISQRCYCRCDTTQGRKYGMCKDFSSDAWQVPREVMDVFFPPDDDAPAPKAAQQQTVAAMPSRGGGYWMGALFGGPAKRRRT